MRIVDPQSAVLTNIEVLAYLTANPPRRPPNPPPNSQNWAPSPDLRDHNTVVKEIHNYVTRLSPHLLKYPRYLSPAQLQAHTQSGAATGVTTGTIATAVPPSSSATDAKPNPDLPPSQVLPPPPPPPDPTPTPMDIALRTLVSRLQPYGLTKGEVVMILNLGVGLTGGQEAGAAHVQGVGVGVDGAMEVETEGEVEVNGDDVHAENIDIGTHTAESQEEEEDGADIADGDEADMVDEGEEEDYGALALLDTVIEEREERLSSEDTKAALAIIRETLLSAHTGGQ